MNLIRRITNRVLRSARYRIKQTPRLERLARAILNRVRGTVAPVRAPEPTPCIAPPPASPLGPVAAGVLADLDAARNAHARPAP
ncbi:hypothetical protein GCM10025771_19910 [Niveibacterium umoris]|uniref:Uncharacterized protein n=1 Tax=Niveibacterium umoris TaxID=1193620 RepID=A0A840BIL0_9RHOO|nr:hypothetical protein [Niveibacterium umoris]MBB4012820.1 hypothetical protein [Niveibacterium umoris]